MPEKFIRSSEENGLSEREGFEEREREHGESRGEREAKMEPSTSPPVSTMDQIMAAEQEKWLADAKAAVKLQAFYMKRAIAEDNLRDVFKYSSAMLGELRTSLLSPQKVRPSIPNVLARRVPRLTPTRFLDTHQTNKKIDTWSLPAVLRVVHAGLRRTEAAGNVF